MVKKAGGMVGVDIRPKTKKVCVWNLTLRVALFVLERF
jgi:hypothetical protein